MEEQKQAQFNGWVLVEIMGHRRAAGLVTTEYIGTAAFLRVVTPEVPPTEVTLERDAWLQNGSRAYAGSIVRMSRPMTEVLVVSCSIYAITPITEDQVLAHAPLNQELVFLAERKMIDAPAIDPDDDDSVPY